MPDKSGYDVCRFCAISILVGQYTGATIPRIAQRGVNRQAAAPTSIRKSLSKARRYSTVSVRFSPRDPEGTSPSCLCGVAPSENEPASLGGRPCLGRKRNCITLKTSPVLFRESAGRIKELEGLLEEEKTISGRLREQATVHGFTRPLDRDGNLLLVISVYWSPGSSWSDAIRVGSSGR